jgi:hypothetical protein
MSSSTQGKIRTAIAASEGSSSKPQEETLKQPSRLCRRLATY